jgi:NAD(P)-dependent dehydrogenase (short-subunit alcohol dehydrogenase family)
VIAPNRNQARGDVLPYDAIASIEDRTALVTGAGRGIGRATAIELAAVGVDVAILARSPDQLEETATRVRELGRSAFILQADLSDPGQVSRSLRQIQDQLGVIDIVVNNASVVWPLGPSVQVAPGEWAAAIGINLTALAVVTFAFLPGMIAQRWGRIVNVSSDVAGHPGAMIGASAYVTSKSALEAFTLNLAAELAGSGVTVNAFRPGTVDTAMLDSLRSQDPSAVGGALYDRFSQASRDGSLITPQASARSLLDHVLHPSATGEVWE